MRTPFTWRRAKGGTRGVYPKTIHGGPTFSETPPRLDDHLRQYGIWSSRFQDFTLLDIGSSYPTQLHYETPMDERENPASKHVGNILTNQTPYNKRLNDTESPCKYTNDRPNDFGIWRQLIIHPVEWIGIFKSTSVTLSFCQEKLSRNPIRVYSIRSWKYRPKPVLFGTFRLSDTILFVPVTVSGAQKNGYTEK